MGGTTVFAFSMMMTTTSTCVNYEVHVKVEVNVENANMAFFSLQFYSGDRI